MKKIALILTVILAATFCNNLQAQQKQETLPMSAVDVQPAFQGENAGSFAKWVFTQLKYPEQAVKENLTGKVIVQFTISKTGDVKDIKSANKMFEYTGADGIMVARGDLGVEIPAYELPHLQKMLIQKCNDALKPVITATQMLDSMIRNPRPTRAEVTDVANAVYDGTDVVMLSGETANGKYPVEALKMMVHIVTEAESHLDDSFYKVRKVGETSSHDISNAVCYASVTTAKTLDAKVILSPTISGYTARMLSKWHPSTRIVCVSAKPESVRRMQLYWGVTPLVGAWAEMIDDKIMHAIDMLKEKEIVAEGDLVVVTAGTLGHSRKNEPATATNGMRVVVVD